MSSKKVNAYKCIINQKRRKAFPVYLRNRKVISAMDGGSNGKSYIILHPVVIPERLVGAWAGVKIDEFDNCEPVDEACQHSVTK